MGQIKRKGLVYGFVILTGSMSCHYLDRKGFTPEDFTSMETEFPIELGRRENATNINIVTIDRLIEEAEEFVGNRITLKGNYRSVPDKRAYIWQKKEDIHIGIGSVNSKLFTVEQLFGFYKLSGAIITVTGTFSIDSALDSVNYQYGQLEDVESIIIHSVSSD